MPAKKDCFNANYFLILVLLVFFGLLYVYATHIYNAKPFLNDRSENFAAESPKLLPADKLVVIQGNGIPDSPVQPTELDMNDQSAPSVDGSANGPKSKFLFAFNECKPSCCEKSGGYACNGGCPCLTEDQQKFFFSRGFNHKSSKCSFDEPGY